MNNQELLIQKFYSSFQNKDYRAMQECYHESVEFSDPVFVGLKGNQARAMWHMLSTGGGDLKIEFRDITANDSTGSCHWEAWYTFSKTGRKVHNMIDASFEFRDGKIFCHTDHFDFHRWSGMALGITGRLFGWASFLRDKVRKMARQNLERFIREHNEYAS